MSDYETIRIEAIEGADETKAEVEPEPEVERFDLPPSPRERLPSPPLPRRP